MSPTPSIPMSPAPGKDPPQPETLESFPTLSSPPSNEQQSKDIAVDKDTQAMPPPPLPSSNSRSRPSITTQAPSQSNILHSEPLKSQSYSNLHTIQTQSQLGNISQEIEGMDTTLVERPPHFQEFFVLVDDLKEKSTHHPTKVHYLFADDDVSEVLGGCLARCADTAAGDEAGGSARKKRERVERVVIVDIGGRGDEVTRVNSLSTDWQILNVGIEAAPTFEGDDGEEEKGIGGLMLRLGGVGVEGLGEGVVSFDKGKERERDGRGVDAMGEDEMREIIEGFDTTMRVLRGVVESREKQTGKVEES